MHNNSNFTAVHRQRTADQSHFQAPGAQDLALAAGVEKDGQARHQQCSSNTNDLHNTQTFGQQLGCSIAKHKQHKACKQ